MGKIFFLRCWKWIVIIVYGTIILKAQATPLSKKVTTNQDNKTDEYGKTDSMFLKVKQTSVTESTTEYTTTRAQADCGEDILANESGTLAWPSVTGTYDKNTICRWSIRTNISDFYIRAHFTKMDIQDHTNCSNDYIEVVWKKGDSGHRKFCGWRTRNDEFEGSIINITFFSDGEEQLTGVELTYTLSKATQNTNENDANREQADSHFSTATPVNMNVNTTEDNKTDQYVKADCGEDILANESGTLAWPSVTGTYDKNTICRWSIRTNISDFYIRAHFTKMDIQDHTNCSNDYIEVVWKKGDSGHRKFCGWRTPNDEFEGSVINITFFSDGEEQLTGFELTYTLSKAIQKTNENDTNREQAVLILAGLYSMGILLLIAVIIIILLVIKIRKKRGEPPCLNSGTNEKASAGCDVVALQQIPLNAYDEILIHATDEENDEYDHFQRVGQSRIQITPAAAVHHYNHVQRVAEGNDQSTMTDNANIYDHFQRVDGKR